MYDDSVEPTCFFANGDVGLDHKGITSQVGAPTSVNSWMVF